MDADRLAELQCLDPGYEFADDARVPITIRDLRDLVALVPVAKTSLEWFAKWEQAARLVDHTPLMLAVLEMRSPESKEAP